MPILEIPWEQSRYYLAKYKADGLRPRGGSMFIFPGKVPSELRQFVTQDFSFARWIEDDLMEKAGKPFIPTKRSSNVFTPRPHQKDGAKEIYSAFMRGSAGFLLADSTGLGKTLTTLVAATAIVKKRGFGPKNKAKVLVVCPKGVIPVWRNTLQSYPSSTAHMRVMVLNYQQLNKLLEKPKSAKKVKKTKTKNRKTAKEGTPTVDWDLVVFDEAHYLKNYPASGMSIAASNVARLHEPYVPGKSPFVIYSTATPGASPLNFALMAPWLSSLLSPTTTVSDRTPEGWAPFLQSIGFAVKKGKVSWSWASAPWFGKDSDDPNERRKYERALKTAKAQQRADAQRIGAALKTPKAPFLMRKPTDIAGWPKQQVIPMPVTLSPQKFSAYEEAWNVFRGWLKLHPRGSDSKSGLVQQLRYRQKASLLKVDDVADFVEEQVYAGSQVYISVEFIETLDRFKEILEGRGISCSECSGRNSADREEERLRFQRGESKVILSTVVAGVSFHAEESLPDGTKATSATRITILHDTRANNLDSTQALGRCHRDGMNSIAYIPVAENTVEESVGAAFANKTANMESMLGAEMKEAESLEEIYRQALGLN